MHGRVWGNGKLVGVCAAIALALALTAVLRFADSAPAADTPAADTASLLGVNVSRGHVDLAMLAPPGSTVTFFEAIDGALVELGTASTLAPAAGDGDGLASIPAVPWRCDRTVRHFEAEARAPDGRVVRAANDARTPDCRDRIALTAPTRVAPGAKVPITLKDRWQLGDLRVRLCVARTAASRRCSSLRFEPGQKSISLTRNAGAAVGVLDIDLVVARFHRHQKVGVGRAAPAGGNRPVVLVTGDSMMEGIDTILAEKLKGRFRVIGQTRPGTGVSKELGTPWTAFARGQAAKYKPAISIVLLGGNDGFAMKTAAGTVECCGEPWRAEYLERLEAMATAYLRDGRGALVWALLPPPRRSDLVAQTSAVNDAIRRLAAARPEIRLVSLDKLFGPDYRDVIDGKRVRDPDGLHFSLAGQRIAATAIVEAVRAVSPAVRSPTS